MWTILVILIEGSCKLLFEPYRLLMQLFGNEKRLEWRQLVFPIDHLFLLQIGLDLVVVYLLLTGAWFAALIAVLCRVAIVGGIALGILAYFCTLWVIREWRFYKGYLSD